MIRSPGGFINVNEELLEVTRSVAWTQEYSTKQEACKNAANVLSDHLYLRRPTIARQAVKNHESESLKTPRGRKSEIDEKGRAIGEKLQMGENDEPPILRSINNDHRSFVRFVNRTLHSVEVYWIDYQGQAIRYGVLMHDHYMDINTFVTHPWIFVDPQTRDRYTVNQRDVYFPQPWFAKYRGAARDQLPQRIERTCIYITLPIYTLRELSLRAIKRCLMNDRQAFLLDIPRSLQDELAKMLPRRDGKEEREEEREERGS